MCSFQRFIAAAFWAILCVALPAQTPGLILHHGKIVTVDADFSITEAVAIESDRIVAVGSNADIQKLAGAATRQIDLQGKTVIPGLMDTHSHATGAAMYEFDHTVPDMETIADVLAYIGARADVLEDGQWIRVRQVFITRLREQRYPTRAELDEAAPNNPVYFSTGPDASLNSLALELSGIDKDYRITDGKPGRIERDAETGEPTGIVRGGSRFINTSQAKRHRQPPTSSAASRNCWPTTTRSALPASPTAMPARERWSSTAGSVTRTS